jgi:3-hydroxyacyl-CoA dehydrogenase
MVVSRLRVLRALCGEPGKESMMWIFKVGVVGAGAMGGGIGQVVTYVGLPVVVKDIDQGQLDAARKHVEGIYQSRIDKGKMTIGQVQEKLDLIEYTLDYGEFADVDIVIEAVPEVMKIKRQVLKELDEACPPDTIFASNTSALSITEMGAATNRPHKMIGMHFFNPAHIMKLVEIIPGGETDQDTIDTVEQFTQELRKIPVVVKECPGFLVNRLLMPYLNEAVLAVEEGAATAQEIDEAMGRGGFGWPMGPFFLQDMLGIDVCANVGEYLYSQYGDRVQPARLYYKLVELGRFGEKTGAGFFNYGDADAEPLDVIIQRMQEAGEVKTGTSFSPERLTMPFLNEAALCVQEDIANVNDIDMACIAGIGMQVRSDGELVRMGPLEYCDELGLDVVLEKLEALEHELGARFHPVDILYQKVRAGNLGKKTGYGFKEYTV